jgi:hypothetical protein
LGIFGREYSEITIQEYEEAVKNLKPFLTYVKNAKERDSRLTRFIDENLRNDFKYSRFKGTQDLATQVESDLNRFILETLGIGLIERAKQKAKAIALIKEEEATPKIQNDQVERAEMAFLQNNNIDSLAMITIALESSLRKVLKQKGINAERKPFGEIIQLAAKAPILNSSDVNNLREISHFRNRAVHEGEMPNLQTTKWILDTSRVILHNLDNQSESNIPNDVKNFMATKRADPQINRFFGVLVLEIEKLSEVQRIIKKM